MINTILKNDETLQSSGSENPSTHTRMLPVEEDSQRLWAFLKWTVNKFKPRYAMPGLTFPHWPLGSRGICHAALMQKAAWCRRFFAIRDDGSVEQSIPNLHRTRTLPSGKHPKNYGKIHNF